MGILFFFSSFLTAEIYVLGDNGQLAHVYKTQGGGKFVWKQVDFLSRIDTTFLENQKTYSSHGDYESWIIAEKKTKTLVPSGTSDGQSDSSPSYQPAPVGFPPDSLLKNENTRSYAIYVKDKKNTGGKVEEIRLPPFEKAPSLALLDGEKNLFLKFGGTMHPAPEFAFRSHDGKLFLRQEQMVLDGFPANVVDLVPYRKGKGALVMTADGSLYQVAFYNGQGGNRHFRPLPLLRAGVMLRVWSDGENTLALCKDGKVFHLKPLPEVLSLTDFTVANEFVTVMGYPDEYPKSPTLAVFRNSFEAQQYWQKLHPLWSVTETKRAPNVEGANFFVTTAKGELFRVEKVKGEKITWVQVAPTDLDQFFVEKSESHFRQGALETKCPASVSREQPPFIWLRKQGGAWQKVELPQGTPKVSRAHVDGLGNLFLESQIGKTKQWAIRTSAGRYFSHQELEELGLTDPIEELLPFPTAAGTLAKSFDGALYKIVLSNPEKPEQTQLHLFKLAEKGKIKCLLSAGAYSMIETADDGDWGIIRNPHNLNSEDWEEQLISMGGENYPWKGNVCLFGSNDEGVKLGIKKRLQIESSESDLKAVYKETDALKRLLREKVVDQGRLTDAMVELWEQAQLGKTPKGSIRVILAAGPTGAGKTFSSQKFAEYALEDGEALLEIDAPLYQDRWDVATLLGAAPGLVSSDTSSGVLPDFLKSLKKRKEEGKSSAKGIVVVVNELGRGCKAFIDAIMEILDTGKVRARDGKTYLMGKALFVFTTNKGDDRIYPRGIGKALSRAELENRLLRFTDQDVKNLLTESDPKDRGEEGSQLTAAFVQRIHRAVAVGPPSYEGAIKIVQQEADRLNENSDFGVKIKVEESVISHIVDTLYLPENGVRSLTAQLLTIFHRALKSAVTVLKVRKNSQVTVSYEGSPEGEIPYYFVRGGTGSREDKILGSYAPIPFENPLTDPKARKKLYQLEPLIQEQVFGQPEATVMTVRAIRSKAIIPERQKPATVLYLGSTGTGKTEMAKAVARILYEDIRRMEAFDLGKITDRTKLGEVFGVGLGYKGCDRIGAFEQFLLNFPEGGVILFDEVGNIGGSSTDGEEIKATILKIFYSMLDEGTWRNPEGKVYDLRKYTLIFTSNEGQEIFGNAVNDDQRHLLWQIAKEQENLIQLLKGHGWPEPLIARFMGNIALFKPLATQDRERIGEKLVARALDPLVKALGIKEVKTAPDFYRQLGDAIYSAQRGARAIEGFSQQTLIDFVASAVFQNDDPDFLRGKVIHLSLEDSYSGKFMYEGQRPPTRKVVLKLSLESKVGKKSLYELDVTNQAAHKILTGKALSIKIALHEAGHVILNNPERSGFDTELLTIVRYGNHGGQATLATNHLRSTMTRQDVIERIAFFLAGAETEKLFGFPPDNGWSDDLLKVREIAEEAITKWGLSEKQFMHLSAEEAKSEIAKLLERGEKLAQEQVKVNQVRIKLLAHELIQKGSLNRPQIAEILARKMAKRCSGELVEFSKDITAAAATYK